MKKQTRPKAEPGSLQKLDDGNLQLPDYLNPSNANMFRSPSKVRMPNGVYGPEQFHVKDERERQEVARLRRLADVRAAVYSNRPAMPPRPQGSPASTPNLHHEFATKTHLGRLDVAYEKLDAYVEKSVEQLIAAMKEQRQGLEERMDSRLEGFDERITLVVNTANETRSALDAAIGHAARRSEEQQLPDAETSAKLSACEERLEKLSECEERLEKLETAANQEAGEAGMQVKHSETRFQTVEDRIEKLEKLENDVEERIEKLEKLDNAVQECIEKLEVSTATAEEQTRATLDSAIDDMVKQSSEKAAAADMQAKLSDTRVENLQVMLTDLSARMEAEQLRTKIFDSRVEGLQTAVGELGARFEEARTGGNLQSVISDLSLRLEAEQARTVKRLDSLQDQFVGSVATGGQISVLEERVTALANSVSETRSSTGDVRTALDKAVHDLSGKLETELHDLSGKLETRSTAAETASAETIAKAVDDRIASIDGLRAAMTDMAARMEDEQARAWKRLDDIQVNTVGKSYIDERLNVLEWIKAEQLRVSKRLEEIHESCISKAYIDERLHASDTRLQHLETVRQQDNAAVLPVPSRSDLDDVCRRLETVERMSNDVQELRWRQEAFTSNLDMLARRLQDMISAADTRVQEAAAREAAAKEAAAKEAAAKEAAVSEAAAKEALAQTEAAAKEAATKDAVAKEAAVKEAEVVSDLMRECVVGLECKLTDMQQRLDVCAPLEIVNQMGVRMDGGFDALVVQLEATRWMIQKTEEVGDHIMQAFVLNVDERLQRVEDIISKQSEYIKRHTAGFRGHTGTLRGHHKHGHSRGNHTSRSKSDKKLEHSATREAIEKAETQILTFWFDVWARGPRTRIEIPTSPSSNLVRSA